MPQLRRWYVRGYDGGDLVQQLRGWAVCGCCGIDFLDKLFGMRGWDLLGVGGKRMHGLRRRVLSGSIEFNGMRFVPDGHLSTPNFFHHLRSLPIWLILRCSGTHRSHGCLRLGHVFGGVSVDLFFMPRGHLPGGYRRFSL